MAPTYTPAMRLTFERVAIINRSEAAMRLMNAVHDLQHESGVNLRTIAFYTEPDRSSMFVRQADESICLGTATFVDPRDGQRKSKYLDYHALRRALVESRADAAWVGWGFVAEHAEFADLCRELGIVFIGPDGDVMRRMGDKIAAKRLAESAGVPVAPWSGGPIETPAEALAHADRLGFPLMVKAAAGGGGRGVRRVRAREELEEAYSSAQSEAQRYFGSGSVFLERAIRDARHVEVQILADHHGTCWALGVRDCTLQRRNQKIVEEAPLPFDDPDLERELCAAAQHLSEVARYRNAGTVEFLWETGTRRFYFMEMNTRLQVEHPVTEVTTGVDLVKMQLLLASGGQLQGPPPPTVGHAIEVRLNAEDPDDDFAPAPGRLELLRLPTGVGLRIDTGVGQGDTIAAEFDSMIAKLVAHGRDRREALGRLRRALSQSVMVIRGGVTNRAFLFDLVCHPEVVACRTDIEWLDRLGSIAPKKVPAHADVALLRAAIDVYDHEFGRELRGFFASAARGRPAIRVEVGRSVNLGYQRQTYQMGVRRTGPSDYRVSVDHAQVDVRVDRQGEFESWVTCHGTRHRVVTVLDGPRHRVEVNGVPHRVAHGDGGVVRASAPSVVLAIHVQPGDTVRAGDPLLVLEAMKTETTVVAPSAGLVKEVKVSSSTQVAAGAPLVVLASAAEGEDAGAPARVGFGEPASRQASRALTCRAVLAEIRHLMLGYDFDTQESRRLAESWAAARKLVALDDQEVWSSENELLDIFVDLATLHDDESTRVSAGSPSAEEHLHSCLRSIHLGGLDPPAGFSEKLARALRHYGVHGLTLAPELEEALLFAGRAHRRHDDCAVHLFSLLEFRVAHADALVDLATPAFRDQLDRLLAVTQDHDLPINHLARQARFQFFDRPLFESSLAEAHQQVTRALRQIVEHGQGAECAYLMDTVVECPHPLQGLLISFFANPDTGLRRFSLEAMFRRFYRLRRLDRVLLEESQGHSVIAADYQHCGAPSHAVATHAALSQLGRALAAVGPTLARYQASEPASLDLYAAHDGPSLEIDDLRRIIVRELAMAQFPRPLAHVSVVVAGPGRENRVHSFTYVLGEDGRYSEHDVHPWMHPMVAERLEVWRLVNFELEQLPAPEDVYLFHLVARENRRDERLFALVDVNDTTPLVADSGAVVGLPHLEHLYLQAVAALHEHQARRAGRDRLQWNRIVLFLWSVTELTPAETMRIARRLAPASRHSGLEKAVVRMRVRDDPSGELVEQVLHVSDRAGAGLHVHFDSISMAPVRPLTAYAQKIIHMRHIGLVYPYEIIRMLTPSRTEGPAEFPVGDFTEYDLDSVLSLVPVTRAPGLNQANVVVGVLRNFTAKHPEGMTRVAILGDGSREMGALSEPECARIMAALDMAHEMGVPVDWFPVSSGAKIAMDVGTEGLDAVARVARRVIEFTQAGGEINMVVAGVNVGAQSYFNAEATMLMHTKGILVMTPPGAMVLTGKRALDYSGGVSAETNLGIGGFERIMGPNGQAQYHARDVAEACHILLRHHEHAYVVPGERFPRRARTSDPRDRDVRGEPHAGSEETGFRTVGDVFSADQNPGRKKSFDIRSVMRSVVDRDHEPLERWLQMRGAETAVTWDAHLGGIPVCLVGCESRPLPRLGAVPADGPEAWTGGTLFPLSSKKVARSINAASGNRPVVVLANLSGFDGSPESMRTLQLEYGAEIARAVVNFDGPIVFCVISRYHGGAYVVFSRTLNEQLEVAALEGSHASVIGGAPAAAVVFPGEVKARTLRDPRVQEVQAELTRASESDKPRIAARYAELYRRVYAEKQGEVADHFDRVHSIVRAREVGSLHRIISARELRPYLIEAVERGMDRVLSAWSAVRRG
jgi:acetyl/propionyl-CoA carboxylase alpha subunit/acetyl-CoA carboxylase carboxyltransferase component